MGRDVVVPTVLPEALESLRAQSRVQGPHLGDAVQAHLGVDPSAVPMVRLDLPSYQLVNLDLAVDAFVAAHGGGQLLGVGGGDQRHHQTFGDMLARRGAWGSPVAVLQSAANRQYDNACRLEVVAAGDVSDAPIPARGHARGSPAWCWRATPCRWSRMRRSWPMPCSRRWSSWRTGT